MFLKLISVCVAMVLLVVVYLNMDIHESPILLPPKNEGEKEVHQVFSQQKEPSLVKDKCESYIATPTGKICLSPRISNDDKKDTEASATSLTAPVEDFSIPNYLSNSEDIPSSTGKDVEVVIHIKAEPSKVEPEAVLISPF